MIAPSKRRSAEPVRGALLTLHVATARRLAAQRRAWRGSLAALGGSVLVAVVARFVPVPPLTHLALVAVAGMSGAALPLPSLRRPALDHIARQAGLAYETALGLPPAEAAAADPYGLRAQLVERAGLSVRDYEPPAAPAWWLPVLALALAVVVLTQALPRQAASSTGAAEGSAAPAGEPLEPEAAPQGGELTPVQEAPARADGAGAPDLDGNTLDGRDAIPPGGSEAGNDALSRFLEALRQQSGQGGEGGEGGAAAIGAAEAEAPAEGEPAGAGAGAAEVPAGADDRSASPGAGEGASPGTNEAAGDERAEGGEDGGGPGRQPGTEPGGEAAEAEGSAAGQGAPPQARDGQDAGADERGLTEDDQAAGGAREEGATPGGGGDSGVSVGGSQGEGDSAVGVGGGAVADGEDAQGTGLLAGGVELLPGVLLPGPTTAAGNVRLPGDDQVELPPGTPLAPYLTAAEEALGEGDLPAGYQEIIRRYFR